jgi:predicted RNase H-like nuclease (RuvC/YqgF family)
VRGKERELTAVREERRARERWWETEVETTVIREEKADYEEKIKRLEEEVQRLTAEVRDFLPYTMSHPC